MIRFGKSPLSPWVAPKSKQQVKINALNQLSAGNCNPCSVSASWQVATLAALTGYTRRGTCTGYSSAGPTLGEWATSIKMEGFRLIIAEPGIRRAEVRRRWCVTLWVALWRVHNFKCEISFVDCWKTCIMSFQYDNVSPVLPWCLLLVLYYQS